MKSLSLSLIACFLMTGFSAFGQLAQEGNFPFTSGKLKNANGISIVMDGTPEQVMTVVATQLEERIGEKPKKFKKDLLSIESAAWAGVFEGNMDYYYRAEEIKKGKAGQTRLTFFVSAGNFNFVDSKKFSGELQALSSWMEGLPSEVFLYAQRAKILAQQTIIEEERKKLEKLQGQQQDLMKEVTKAEEEVKKAQEAVIKAQKDLEKQQQDVLNQQKVLEEEEKKLQRIVNDRN